MESRRHSFRGPVSHPAQDERAAQGVIAAREAGGLRARRVQIEARKAVLMALAGADIRDGVIGLAFGVTGQRIYAMRVELGLARPEPHSGNDSRDAEIEDLARSGATLDGIAIRFGVTRERVRQILNKRGVPSDAARIVRSLDLQRRREKMRRGIWNAKASAMYGCDYETARALNGGATFSTQHSRARLYVEQRRNSIKRGIAWEIKFPEWCQIWDESGKWSDRGRGKYVMARIGDCGPYKVGNVEIITAAQNSRDSYLVISMAERLAKREVVRDPAHMSPRQLQALELYRLGKKTREIAEILGIQHRNAWNLVDQVKRKLALLEQRKAA